MSVVDVVAARLPRPGVPSAFGRDEAMKNDRPAARRRRSTRLTGCAPGDHDDDDGVTGANADLRYIAAVSVVRLGPFLVERPIARGGMAEVWRGQHEGQRVPVAIKVLTGVYARDDAFVRALTNEIHAVARLDHPGIIVVYDRGTVDDVAADASGGRLVAGSPWLAMELCSHGALSSRRFPLPWTTTRTLLLSLLDALAHAHARGVIHRDLKPGNVLIAGADDPRPGLKLSDFGIAQPLGLVGDDAGAGRAHAWSGTPRSMAPEQFNGLARELGPWTDLYALGCMAFQVARGHAPFSGDAGQLAVAHCHERVPDLGELAGYPAGYEGWVLRLLEKRPGDRFASAADAAWALLRLDDARPLASGWHDALLSLIPDTATRGGHLVHPDDDGTWTRTLGPPRFEPLASQRSSQRSQLARHDDSTGPMLAPVHVPGLPHDAGVTQMPTAVARRVALTAPPLTDARVAAVADDDPFAMMLAEAMPAAAVDDDRSAQRRGPVPPWFELLGTARASSDGALDGVHDDAHDAPPHDEPATVGGPVLSTTSGRTLRARDPRRRAPCAAPPVPRDWRRGDDDRGRSTASSRLRLLGVGRGLWGLRRPPFIGRLEERDRLWQVLHERGPRVVVVAGAAGIGRSRLLSWFGERAAEVGAVTALRIGDDRGRIIDAIARHLRVPTTLLSRRQPAAMLRWLKAVLPGFELAELRLLTAMLLPGANVDDDDRDHGRAPGQEVDLDDVGRRDALVCRLLAFISPTRRPLLLVDDAHDDEAAIHFARRLATRALSAGDADPLAPIVVLAVADEALVERPDALAAMSAMADVDDVLVMSMAPLPPKQHRQLVGGLLGLEPGLADAVAARSDGNPRFAVDIVGDFIDRGVLELGVAGFGVKAGAGEHLPDSVHAVWSTRLLRLLSTLPADARRCLELGAVLGADSDAVWIAACERAGIVDAEALVADVGAAMERARLIVSEQPGARRFSHAMLRESMLRLCADGGRLGAHHLLVATVLEDADDLRTIARRAQHLLAARDAGVAVAIDDVAAAFLRLTRRQWRAEGPANALATIAVLDGVFERDRVADDAPWRRRADALRALCLAEAGRFEESQMWSQLIDEQAPRVARLDALAARAAVARWRGDHEQHVEQCRAALVLAEDHHDDDDDDRAIDEQAIDAALLGLAGAHLDIGRLDDASSLATRAIERAQRSNDHVAAGLGLCLLASVALWRGAPASARTFALRAQKLARRHHLRPLIAASRSVLGDVERVAGLPSEARNHAEEALRVLTVAGDARRRRAALEVALSELALDRFADAQARAAALVVDAVAVGDARSAATAHGVLALGAIRAADWSAADAHLVALLEPWSRGVIDGEHALLVEQCARAAIAAGEPWRAGVANGCARELWLALGRDDRLETLPTTTMTNATTLAS